MIENASVLEPALLDHEALVVAAEPEPHFGYDFVKRTMDVLGATLLLMLLLPVILGVALAIAATSGKPIFFKQRRLGLHGKEFHCWKFRTMVPDAESRREQLISQNTTGGPTFKLQHDPRLTSVGRFLRRTSLDELPQLLNVLAGDMSLVGPRPLPTYENQYRGQQARRLGVKPGLTCTWQISGRSGITFDRWMEMDIEYVESRSTFKDIAILLRTPAAVVSGRGAM